MNTNKSNTTRRRCAHRVTFLGLSALLLSTTSVIAADYPSTVIRMVVPFAAGGGTDVLARIVAAELTEDLGQNVIVENKGGAAGGIGTQEVVDAAADGYTLLFSPAAPYTLSPHLKPAPTYDAEADLLPVARIAEQPTLFVVRADAGYATLEDFLDAAKAEPGNLSYSSSGAGGEMHLTVKALELESGTEMLHAAYRGGGAAILGLVTGEVDMMPVVTGSITPYIQDGSVVALATTAPERLPAFADVPTTAELGYPTVNNIPSWGLFAPMGTPDQIVAKLESTVAALMDDEKFTKAIENLSMNEAYLDHEGFLNFLKTQSANYADLIAKTDIASN